MERCRRKTSLVRRRKMSTLSLIGFTHESKMPRSLSVPSRVASCCARLNRVEYQNTINDLFGLQLNLIDELPHDGSADGFDNAGAALHTSSFLMERYLEAADIALNEAITNLPQPALVQERMYCWDQHHIKTSTERSLSTARRFRGPLQFIGMEFGPHVRILSTRSRPLSISHFGQRLPEQRATCHLSRRRRQHSVKRHQRSRRVLRRAAG